MKLLRFYMVLKIEDDVQTGENCDGCSVMYSSKMGG